VLEAHQYGWVRFPDLIGGTRRFVRFDEKGEIFIRYENDMDDIQVALDHNKKARNETSGKMMGGDMVRAMSVPEGVRIMWLVEEGWDCNDPQYNDRLVKKMNDLDYLYLRTGGGRVALQQDGCIR
jgi:hypothetical protein